MEANYVSTTQYGIKYIILVKIVYTVHKNAHNWLYFYGEHVTVLVLTQRGIQPTNVSSTTFKTITKDIRETALMDLTTHVKCYTF
jgi:hypothetical protein